MAAEKVRVKAYGVDQATGRLTTDSLTNFVSGLGYASKDKSVWTLYGLNFIDKNQLLAAYRSDWIARKVVDIPAYDATRAWREWQAENDQIEKIEELERTMGIQFKACAALKRGRLFGGGGLILGMADKNHASELIVEKVKQGDLKYVHVFGRFDLTVGEINRDMTSPYFGEPKMYLAHKGDGTQVQIHPSRVVRFPGNEIPDYSTGNIDGWGDSILMAIDDAVKQAGSTAANLAQLVWEAKLDVISSPNFLANIATAEYRTRMTNRYTMANLAKGINNTLMIDGEEKWEHRQMNFTGFPELIEAYLSIASAAADIPVTRMLGQSPGGLNSSGESDTRNYYDRIGSDQKMFIQPPMSRLDEVLIRSALGARDTQIHYKWATLWQQTDEERANTALKKAQAFKIDVDSGMFPDDALAQARHNQLIEDGTYPGLESALEEAEHDLHFEEAAVQAEEQFAATQEMALAQAKAKPPVAAGAKRPPAFAKDAAPRTLYVRRDVLNVAAIQKWAAAQGFTDIVPDLHVTIAYSRKPVDWFKVGTSWTEKIEIVGGPRLMERMGPDGRYSALLMTAPELIWRHREIVESGATWEWPDYQPHISIQIGGDVDLSKVAPFQGKIVLGPEIFEEVREKANG